MPTWSCWVGLHGFCQCWSCDDLKVFPLWFRSGDNVHKLQRMEKLIGDRRVEDERSLIKTPDVQANNQEHDSPTSTHQIRSDQHGSPCFIYTLAFFSALGGFLLAMIQEWCLEPCSCSRGRWTSALCGRSCWCPSLLVPRLFLLWLEGISTDSTAGESAYCSPASSSLLEESSWASHKTKRFFCVGDLRLGLG